MTSVVVEGQVGVQTLSDGVGQAFRQGRQAELIVSELHGRFYEQNFRGNIFSGGMTLTAINNATFTSATTGATATPVAGVWNPAGSSVNLEILQAVLSVTLTALQATGAGPFVWAASAGNPATVQQITTGLKPFSRKTLQQSGSQALNVSGVALTGLTNALAILGGSALSGGAQYNASLLGTAVGFMPAAAGLTENLDGSIIVPPGGVLVLLATTTPVAHSAASLLVWQEVPL